MSGAGEAVAGSAAEAAEAWAAEASVERGGVGKAWRGKLTAVVVAVTVVLSFMVVLSDGTTGASQPTTVPVQRWASAGVAGRSKTVSFSFILPNASGRCCSPIGSGWEAPAAPPPSAVVALAGAMAGAIFEEWMGWP